jgi:hypothetical protein
VTTDVDESPDFSPSVPCDDDRFRTVIEQKKAAFLGELANVTNPDPALVPIRPDVFFVDLGRRVKAPCESEAIPMCAKKDLRVFREPIYGLCMIFHRERFHR